MPNRAVDVNSRARLACYPRGTFYPLIDGPSTRSRRVTRPGFRLCSACRPHSQAPFCPCTQRTVAVRAEGTFGHLRYLSGGHRPSETAHQAMSLASIQTRRLEPQPDEGGISPVPPPELAPGLHRLPPILHTPGQDSTPGCSKGPRGLSVLPRVGGIFTTTTTSPGPPLRHRPSRYAIRAGRNLPDKEFRSLSPIAFAMEWTISSSGLEEFYHFLQCRPIGRVHIFRYLNYLQQPTFIQMLALFH